MMAKREKDHGFRPIVEFGPVGVSADLDRR